MARFNCTRCGKCCRSFGRNIRIERQLSDRDFYCRDGNTGQIFSAHVQPEYGAEMDQRSPDQGPAGTSPHREGCVFLCEDPGGEGFSCAIYPTRPDICRTFRCYRMIICDGKSGEILGRVIGNREIRTRDENLLAVWKKHIEVLSSQEGAATGTAGNRGAPTGTRLVNARIRGTGTTDDSDWLKRVQSILAGHGYRAEEAE